MEQSTNRRWSLGTLLASVGGLGAVAGAVVLYVFDLPGAFQSWIVQVAVATWLVPVTPGQVVQAEILAMGLLALAGGVALVAAGALVVAYERNLRKSAWRLPAGAPAKSANAA